MIDRNSCWKHLILPITNVNRNKENDFLTFFPYDTGVINMYHQWDKKDWFKKEPILLEVPTMTGELYCVGKATINKRIIGVIWYLFQSDLTYGFGGHYWLATYSLDGKMKDYVCLYYNVKDMWLMKTDKIIVPPDWQLERMYKFKNENNITFLIKTIDNTTFPNADTIRMDTIKRFEYWTLTNEGIFNLRK